MVEVVINKFLAPLPYICCFAFCVRIVFNSAFRYWKFSHRRIYEVLDVDSLLYKYECGSFYTQTTEIRVLILFWS